MPMYFADVHMHTDYDRGRNHWHGERPEVLATHIVFNTRLDVCAITEHNAVTERFFDVREEVDRLCDIQKQREGIERQIAIVLGAELTVMFGNRPYHVGYIFEEAFERGALPELPNLRCHVKDLEHLTFDYPGVRVLNHPTWKDRVPRQRSITGAFMRSGLVDGVEILNGSMLENGHGNKNMQSMIQACELFVGARDKQGSGTQKKPQSLLAPIGSSDAHRAPLVGTVATEYQGMDETSFFEMVRRGSTRAVALSTGKVRDRVRDVCNSVSGVRRYLGHRDVQD